MSYKGDFLNIGILWVLTELLNSGRQIFVFEESMA